MEERLVFAAFFAGAILCLGLSCTYHTVHCHSEFVGKLFSKLDYVGISFLILGSLVPWLYYTFYCQYQPKVIYLTVASILGLGAIIVSLWDQFAEPKYRSFRAGVLSSEISYHFPFDLTVWTIFIGIFIAFGLSGAIPAVHYAVMEGWVNAVSYASLGWLILMGALYILGALLYAGRIPERYFPGKCDIWVRKIDFIFYVMFLISLSICTYIVPKSPNISCFGDCRSIRSLSRNLGNGRLSTDEQSMPSICRSSPCLIITP